MSSYKQQEWADKKKRCGVKVKFEPVIPEMPMDKVAAQQAVDAKTDQ